MCTVTIQVDETILRGLNPELDSTAAIRKWAQQLVDFHIREMESNDSVLARNMSVEELYHAIEEDVKAIYAE